MTRSTRSRSVKLLAAASAAGAFLAAGSAATAAESGAHKDGAGNLQNTELDRHCSAKIKAGYHPPLELNNGTRLEAFGWGNCGKGTRFNHGIVDIQQRLPNGDWVTIGTPTQFTVAQQWNLTSAPAVGNAGPCTEYRSRTRVWRRADSGKPNNPTIAVKSASAFVGQGGICDKL